MGFQTPNDQSDDNPFESDDNSSDSDKDNSEADSTSKDKEPNTRFDGAEIDSHCFPSGICDEARISVDDESDDSVTLLANLLLAIQVVSHVTCPNFIM